MFCFCLPYCTAFLCLFFNLFFVNRVPAIKRHFFFEGGAGLNCSIKRENKNKENCVLKNGNAIINLFLCVRNDTYNM